MLLSFVFRSSEKIDVFGEWSLKFMSDATYDLRDKSEFEGEIASRRRAEFKAPQRGATDVRQGWSGEAAEPLLG